MMSFPETPKVSCWSSMSRAYTMPVKQSGHQVTADGAAPKHVVHDLVAAEEGGAVGAVLAVDGDADHEVDGAELLVRLLGGDESWGLSMAGMASGRRRVTIWELMSPSSSGSSGGVAVAGGWVGVARGVGVSVAGGCVASGGGVEEAVAVAVAVAASVAGGWVAAAGGSPGSEPAQAVAARATMTPSAASAGVLDIGRLRIAAEDLEHAGHAPQPVQGGGAPGVVGVALEVDEEDVLAEGWRAWGGSPSWCS